VLCAGYFYLLSYIAASQSRRGDLSNLAYELFFCSSSIPDRVANCVVSSGLRRLLAAFKIVVCSSSDSTTNPVLQDSKGIHHPIRISDDNVQDMVQTALEPIPAVRAG